MCFTQSKAAAQLTKDGKVSQCLRSGLRANVLFFSSFCSLTSKTKWTLFFLAVTKPIPLFPGEVFLLMDQTSELTLYNSVVGHL